MWRPGFEFISAQEALLYGFHRGFNVFSYHHRGTPSSPGLVLGLDLGGSCRGIAYEIDPEKMASVIDYLREREQVTMVYREVTCGVRLLERQRQKVNAVTYVVERTHEQYAGRLPHNEQVRLIEGSRGVSGTNPDYLQNMIGHLKEMKIKDPALTRLWRGVERRRRPPRTPQ